MDLAIAATDGTGWTGIADNIPTNTHHLSFSASNCQFGQIIAVSSTGGTLSTASSPFYKSLVPGDGWTGPTDPGPIVGNPTANGYTQSENAIADFEMPAFQTTNTTFTLGVKAFHPSGIKRVRFAVEGGPWTDVYAATINLQSANVSDGLGVPTDGLLEYCATILAASFETDGQVQIRAIVEPNIGTPVVLSTIVDVNGHGTLGQLVRYVATDGSDNTGDGSEGNPFATITHAIRDINATQGSVDGGTVYLEAGGYEITDNVSNMTATRTYCTITHAPGLTYADVTITGTQSGGSNQGSKVPYLRLKDMTITGRNNGDYAITNYLWYDGCFFNGGGRWNIPGQSFLEVDWTGVYLTDCSVYDTVGGPIDRTLCRNVRVYHIAEVGFKNPNMLVNCTVEDVDRGLNHDLHNDIVQLPGSSSTYYNRIIDGLSCPGGVISTALRFGPVVDCAFVNIDIEILAPYPYTIEFDHPYQNLLIQDSAFTGDAGQGAIYVLSPPPADFSAIDVFFIRVNFNGAIGNGPQPGVTIIT